MVKGVIVGEQQQSLTDPSAAGQLVSGQSLSGQSLSGLTRLIDAVLFLGILGFSAIAMLVVALAAPLAILVTAIAGAISSFGARGAKRGGWTVAGA